jgi:hypothetical protein
MEDNRKEFNESISSITKLCDHITKQEIISAFKLARGYVNAMQMNLAGAMGHENTVIRPDLERIDKAIRELESIFS